MAKKSKNAKQRIKVRGLPASKRKMAAKDMKKLNGGFWAANEYPLVSPANKTPTTK